MFFSTVLAAGVLAFTASAAPAPLAARAPEPSSSTGIRLVVVPSGADFPEGPVKGLEISAAHTGAGLNRAFADAGEGTIFYSNGTDAQAQSWTAHLINDTPSFPQAFVIMFENSGGESGIQFEVEISADQDANRVPSDGMQVSTAGPAFLDPSNGRNAGNFVICKDTIPYYGDGQIFNALYWVVGSTVPDSCVAVRLVPECAALADLPAGSAWNHDFARQSRCYPDVQSIASFE